MAIQFNLNALSRFSNVNFGEILFSLDSKIVEAPDCLGRDCPNLV